MRKLFLVASFLIAPLASAQDLHTFSNGEVADAEKINENFQTLLDRISALEDVPEVPSVLENLAQMLPVRALHLDASRIDGTPNQFNSNLALGDSVTRWADLSGNANLIVDSSNKAPTWYGTGVYFDGENDYLWDQTGLTLKDVTLVAVARPSVVETSGNYSEGGVVSVSGNNSPNDTFDAIRFGPQSYYHGTERNSRNYRSDQIETTSEITLIYDDVRSGANRLYKNGVSVAEGSFVIPEKPNARFIVGNAYLGPPADPVKIAHWRGEIYEVMVIPGSVSDFDRAVVHHYLALKWGIAGYVDSDGDGATDIADADPLNPGIQ